jgi:hypothetical protein
MVCKRIAIYGFIKFDVFSEDIVGVALDRRDMIVSSACLKVVCKSNQKRRA